MNRISEKRRTDPFRTEVVPEPLHPMITYHDPVMLIGSCFTEHIGNRMIEFKFRADLNPFGIVYNPLSIANQIQNLMNPVPYTEASLVAHLDLWHSPDHHGRFSHPDPGACIRMINDRLMESSQFLRESRFLILTFGSARAYFLKETGQLYANCHQLPASRFTSRILTIDEVSRNLGEVLGELLSRNPGIRIVLNVSPVRYLNLGSFDNQVSKSTLILASRDLAANFREVTYFPSYEIFMDDLRDYRFYDNDLIHPGSAGIEYVWSRFVKSAIDRKSRHLMLEIESLRKAVGHRSKGFLTPSHRNFLETSLKKVGDLAARYPFLDLSEEENHFRSRLL